MLITNGHHMSPDAIAALVCIKGADNCILVTDAVLGAVAPAGPYDFAGMLVERTDAGAMVQPGRSSLASSALCLDDAVRNVVDCSVASADVAIAMASTHPRCALRNALAAHRIEIDPGAVHWDEDLQPTIQAD